MVDSAAAQLRAGVDVDPAIEASMKEAIGRVYFELARYGEADSLLSDAVATRTTLLGEDHVETASAMYYLGQVAWANGQLDRADSLNEAVLAIRRSQLGTRDAEYLMALQNQGTVRYRQARYEEAAEILTEALAIAREIHDEPHDDLSTILNNLANALWASGQREQARDMMEQSLDVGRRIHDGDHPNIAVRLDNLAFMSLQTGDTRSALRFGEEALDMYRRIYPGPHHNMTYPMATIADAAFQLGDTARADSTHRANVALAADVLGGDHPDAVARRSDHAAFLYRAGRYDESEAVYREVIPAMERIGNETHPRFLSVLRTFASVRQAQGEAAEALSLLERAYETGTASLGPDDSRVIEAGRVFADALRAAGDTGRAREIEAQLPDSTST
jgi:tetratricopeptide (TPR) repeat protein